MTTVWPQQGHYVTDARVRTLPPPDVTIERIGELLAWDRRGSASGASVTQRSAHLPTAASACSSARPFSVSSYSTRTGVSGTTSARDDAFGLELAQALGEHPVADLGDRGAQLGEPHPPVEQELDDRAGPAPADELDGAVELRAQMGLQAHDGIVTEPAT